MISLDTQEAKRADNRSQAINEAGKFEGVITRAEKLKSEKGATGVGFSFKSDSGATANYLDLYTHNAKGEKLPSNAIVQAILCCTKTKQVDEGMIEVEKWDKDAKSTYKTKVEGYPDLIGKRVGFLFQRELSDNPKDPSKHNDRVIIYGVFESGTDFTASEILDKATKPEKLPKMVQYISEHPVNDRRTNKAPAAANTAPAGGFDDFSDDIPFMNPYKFNWRTL